VGAPQRRLERHHDAQGRPLLQRQDHALAALYAGRSARDDPYTTCANANCRDLGFAEAI
jgi:hypothetical protein